MSHDEEMRWMEERARELERLRERKSVRRGAFVGYFGNGGSPPSQLGGVGATYVGGGEVEAGDTHASFCGSEGGHCSPVWEEGEGEGEVLVIGFGSGGGEVRIDECEEEEEEQSVMGSLEPWEREEGVGGPY
jgi:hypothetical protein